jgi:hypothetical protein
LSLQRQNPPLANESEMVRTRLVEGKLEAHLKNIDKRNENGGGDGTEELRFGSF